MPVLYSGSAVPKGYKDCGVSVNLVHVPHVCRGT